MAEDARKILSQIKREAVALAESKLRAAISDNSLAPDWHPYYGSYVTTETGVKFTITVRDGERAYFEKKKKQVPFDKAALEALRETIKKYSREMVMAELIKAFETTDGVETS